MEYGRKVTEQGRHVGGSAGAWLYLTCLWVRYRSRRESLSCVRICLAVSANGMRRALLAGQNEMRWLILGGLFGENLFHIKRPLH